jgi:hypothetical protein
VRSGRAATLRFTSSEAGTLTVAVERPAGRGKRDGRRAGRVGRLTARIVRGAGRLRVGARIGRRTLTRGRYVLVVTAADAAGNRSRAVRLSLKVR